MKRPAPHAAQPPLLLVLALAAPAALGACRSTSPARSPAHAGGAARQPALGTFGIDLASMDRTATPGQDFYRYVNGSWLAATEIPSDRSSLSSFALAQDAASERVRALVEAAAGDASARGVRKQVGDFFAAYMDEEGIEARGLEPLHAQLREIDAILDARALAAFLGRTLRADVDILNATQWHTDRIFGLWVTQDLERPGENAAYLVQGGLGMPDRSYYLEEDLASTREAYAAHLARVLVLARLAADEAAAGASAARILALETEIARVHASAEDTGDVKKGANRWSRADFAARAPGLDWEATFAAAGLGGAKEFFVWQPGAVSGIAALVASQPLATWKEYLSLRAVERAAPLLPRALADESFAFYGKTLSGAPEPRPRWKRALSALDGALGEAVGRLYVEKHFTPAAKARAEAMVRALLTAFGARIDRLEWMAPATKARARAKLAGMRVAVGYPDRWRDLSGIEVRRDDALGNAERAQLFEYRRNVQKLGHPVDHGEWAMLPHEVNALNLPIENRLIFPAAILQPPFFDAAADDAVNFGGMGAVIGHEISHSFDSSGALFDEQGRYVNWWTPVDLERFNAAADALAAQFDAYEPLPGMHVNGKLTLPENIADVAGLATAYDAYVATHPDAPTLDGFTPAQRLFLSWAQVWRGKAREASLKNSLLTNPHAPPACRALTVRNQDAWYAAFDVQPSQALYLPPEARVKIW